MSSRHTIKMITYFKTDGDDEIEPVGPILKETTFTFSILLSLRVLNHIPSYFIPRTIVTSTDPRWEILSDPDHTPTVGRVSYMGVLPGLCLPGPS